ncbi:MAG: FtsX-like permease family protein [Candidatus Acidiferrales bacterium]
MRLVSIAKSFARDTFRRRKLAQRFFSGRNPLGLHIEHGAGDNHLDMEIVGVVANSKWDSARSDVVAFMCEIGVRMALGGGRGDILRLVVGQGARLAVIGGAIGTGVALIAARYVASLLYGVDARDPLTFIAVVAVLAVVSGAACYLPARRAMKVDPMVALRHE